MEERQVSSPSKKLRKKDQKGPIEDVIWRISLHFSNHMSFYGSQSRQTVTAIFIQKSTFLTYTVLILQNKLFLSRQADTTNLPKP
jgi:hypothetical protein